MEINEVVIQGLMKEADSAVVKESFRDVPSKMDGRMLSLGDELLRVYGKATNNYGCFDSDKEIYRFPSHLEGYYAGEESLVPFSKVTSRLVADRMKSSLKSTGGYILFLRYENMGRDWLLIVVLKLKTATGIDRETLDLNDSLSFDISHLHEAARVDLEKWKNNEQPYLSFIKRSGRQDEVTRYFRLALGCTEYTDSKSNTDQALKAVDAYCVAMEWTPEKKRDARQKTFNYFEEKRSQDQPVNLEALSGMLNDLEPKSFIEFVKEKEFPVSESFEPHKKTYSRFKRISKSFGTVKISFDVQDVIDEKVDYDEKLKSVIIKDVPESLVQDIRKAKGDESAE